MIIGLILFLGCDNDLYAVVIQSFKVESVSFEWSNCRLTAFIVV